MTDGIAGYRCTTVGSCYWWSGDTSPTGSTLYAVDFINDTDGFAVGTRAGGGRIIRWDGATWTTFLNTGSTLYGVDMYNTTLGFAVGSGGVIMKWNGANWVADATPVGTSIRSVFIVNRTLAYAVGDSGRVLNWNGATWFLNVTYAGILYSVLINNETGEGFIVGSGGQIYRWTYPTWTLATSPTTRDLTDVAFVNRSDYSAYAVGRSGSIIRWNGTGWGNDTSPTTSNLNTTFFVNETLGYALGANGRILKWNVTNWAVDYSPTANTLYGSARVNSQVSFAVGSGGVIIKWAPPLWNGTDTTGNQCCTGNSPGNCDDTGTESCEAAVQNAIWSSGYANQTLQNLTVDSIGFGPVASCDNANTTLLGIADRGNGTYFVSDNATELQLIYQQIGWRILINATIRQEVSISGQFITILYPESYLEFHFNMSVPPLGYKEISVTEETPPFSNCSGNFSIPAWFTPYEARVTSYSANYWTHNVSVKSSATGNIWKNVFNLSVYGLQYDQLGDPFNVRFPATLLRVNETNSLNVTTGVNPFNESAECSTGNRVIYKAKFPASVPFSSVLPYAIGRNVTVYYDINGDGVEDGNQTVLLGYNMEGIPFDPTPVFVNNLDPDTNAIDDAFIRLLDYINFNKQSTCGAVPPDQNRSGMSCNPVDVGLTQDIIFRISSVTEVPYLWGPVDMGIVTWIQQGD
jgi:hypothetical protein